MEINIDGQKINYINKGKGKTVLLLHGWGVNINLYKNIIDNMSKYSNVYALDMPGFGKSDEPKEIWDLDNYVELVEEFINKLKLNNLILIGHSFGGRIIIKMASKNALKFKISRIILLGSAGIKHKLSLKKAIKVKTYKICKKIISSKFINKIFPNLVNNVKNKFGSEDYKNASQIMRGCLVKVINEDLSELLKYINYNTLLIWGTEDKATPLEDGRKMHKLIENSTLIEIQGATHYAFLEKPLYINKVIDKFIMNS